jgi:hypothetical protein
VACIVQAGKLNHAWQIFLVARQVKKGQLSYQPWDESNNVLVCIKRYEFHSLFVLKISTTTTLYSLRFEGVGWFCCCSLS